jgi:acyl-CoA thioesterase YciA
METYLPPNRQLSLKAIVLPVNKDTYSGWLLAQMHLAGSNIATAKAQGNVGVLSINELIFYEPIHVGDEVNYYAEIKHMNRTSLTLHIEALVHRPTQQDDIKIAEGCFIFMVNENNCN